MRQKDSHTTVFTQPISHLPDILEVTLNVFASFNENGHCKNKILKSMGPKIKSLKQDRQSSTNYMERYYYHRKLFFYMQIIDALDKICEQYISETNEKLTA